LDTITALCFTLMTNIHYVDSALHEQTGQDNEQISFYFLIAFSRTFQPNFKRQRPRGLIFITK